MSQELKKNRIARRRLFLETMEDRLLLSISPIGSENLRDLLEVKLFETSTQGASQADLLDFSDMAAQLHNTHVAKQITQATFPSLPKEEESHVLCDPADFLTSAEHADHVSSHLSDRLADELMPLDRDTAGAGGPVSDQLPPPIFAVTDVTTSSRIFTNEGGPWKDFVRQSVSDVGYGFDLDASFLTNTFAARNLDISEDLFGIGGFMKVNSPFRSDGWSDPLDRFGYALNTTGHDADLCRYEMVNIEGLFLADNGHGTMMAAFSGPGGLWGVPTPPTATTAFPALDMYKFDFHSIYQGLEDDSTNTIDILYHLNHFDRSTFTFPDDSFQIQSRDRTPIAWWSYRETQDNTRILGEDFLSGRSDSSDGTATELDIDQLVLLESQVELDTANLEIEGLMNTDPEKLIVDVEASTGEEGGMIDFSAAMNWVQRPVVATVEGIVQAGTHQDDKVAFEGSYGRGQTFELATAEEEKEATTEEPSIQGVSSALLEKLDKTPLNTTNTKENLDKTDTTPTAHEMALSEMRDETDYASTLPPEALAWVAFAFVGQRIIQRPMDRCLSNDPSKAGKEAKSGWNSRILQLYQAHLKCNHQ